ncbi:MAG: ATP-grasp domain-containing protein [Planctomycetota bacterium]|nr:MAG: ATP-grasp domain-containing protein [Planctomycetota bacterium]
MKKLKVLVLMHQELMPPATTEGLSAEEIHPWKMEYDVLWALQELGHETLPLGVKDELLPVRQAIEDWKPHVAFNLMTHFHGVGVYDAHLVSYLELLKTAYTGCNPRGMLVAGDKALSKQILNWHRIQVPGHQVFRRGDRFRINANLKRLRFPLIVKSAVEHASQGIAQASVVQDFGKLEERVAFIHRTIGTEAIAEEFIEGREITVGVLGNRRLQVFPPWEMTFNNLPEGAANIATSKVKWDLKYQKKVGLKTEMAKGLPENLERRIPRLARRIYRALRLSGYARIDFRLTKEGQLFVLEANPNPDLSFGEDFAEAAESQGLAYPKLVQTLLNLGRRYQPAWKEAGT